MGSLNEPNGIHQMTHVAFENIGEYKGYENKNLKSPACLGLGSQRSSHSELFISVTPIMVDSGLET